VLVRVMVCWVAVGPGIFEDQGGGIERETWVGEAEASEGSGDGSVAGLEG